MNVIPSLAVYPYTKHLLAACILSLVGQITAVAFMLALNPFTMFVFMTAGIGLIFVGILIFVWVMYKDIRARVEHLTHQSFAPGEYVFRQGEIGDRVYVVQSGEVEVVREEAGKGEIVLARIGEGEYFGEMALLNNEPRSASIRAVGEVTTLAIERQGFNTLFASIPVFRDNVEVVMGTRIRQRKKQHGF